jgi:hypothetical protein
MCVAEQGAFVRDILYPSKNGLYFFPPKNITMEHIRLNFMCTLAKLQNVGSTTKIPETSPSLALLVSFS